MKIEALTHTRYVDDCLKILPARMFFSNLEEKKHVRQVVFLIAH